MNTRLILRLVRTAGKSADPVMARALFKLYPIRRESFNAALLAGFRSRRTVTEWPF